MGYNRQKASDRISAWTGHSYLVLASLIPARPQQHRTRASPDCLPASQLPIMAASHVTVSSILSSFLPRLTAAAPLSTSKFGILYARQLSIPFLPTLGLGVPSAIHLNVPGFIEGLWESILRAVPKKKTSHMKKRHRQMAGKALKDVTAVNKCSACGNAKRAHLLCPYCVKGKLIFMEYGRIPSPNAFYRNSEHVQGKDYTTEDH